MIKDNGGAAFPRPLSRDELTDTLSWEQEGMTLRDYFAAAALQGLISTPDTGGSPGEFAKSAYDYADAMLEARKE